MTLLLQRVSYACLSGAYTVRLLDGCTGGCGFCYRRGLGHDPAPTTVGLLENPVERIVHALDQLPRNAVPVTHVLIDPDVECFPSDPRTQDSMFRLFRTLLDRKIGISFFTKGVLTRRLVDLFSTNPGRLRGRVGLGGLDPDVAALLEPGAAPPEDRLDTITALAGLDALGEVRIDPIIPGVGDSEAAIERMLESLRSAGVSRAVASYVHLRPAFRELLDRVLPIGGRRVVAEAYQAEGWLDVGSTSEAKLLPRTYREDGYARFRQVGERLGIQVAVCQCKNPDLSGDSCGTVESRLFPQDARRLAHDPSQPSLFPC